MRFSEYVTRFLRLASRYEEEIAGSTSFGFPSAPFAEIPAQLPRLGSGIAFSDEASCLRELAANAHRIEAWRRTNSHKYLIMVVSLSISMHFLYSPVMQDYSKCQSNNSIKGFDLVHQIFRLRYTKNLPDAEALAIMRTLANSVKTYDQIVEVSGPPKGTATLISTKLCFSYLLRYHMGVVYFILASLSSIKRKPSGSTPSIFSTDCVHTQ